MKARGLSGIPLVFARRVLRGICEPRKGRKEAPAGRAGQKGRRFFPPSPISQRRYNIIWPELHRTRDPSSERRDAHIADTTAAGGPGASRGHLGEDRISAAIGRLSEKAPRANEMAVNPS